jgi:glycosyltransferase involved in cell wall biosynthesis
MEIKPRLLRITTVPISLNLLLKGQFAFFRDHGFDVLTASADGPEVSYLKALGVEHEVIPMTRKITLFTDLYCLIKLIILIRRLRPHIVHTHTPKAGLLGMLAAKFCRVPVRMHTVAGLPLMEATGMKRKLLNVTEKVTYACAHQVFPNSYGLLKFIQSTLGVQNSKLKVIGKGSSNGVDTDFFSRHPEQESSADHIRKQYQVSDDEVTFSFVGRLVKDKGIVELVKAFQQICKVLPARLMLIGSFEDDLDPLPNEVMSFIKNDQRVILAGFQQDVRPWIMASDIFVFPSYREGFPNVVMQAACLRTPCVVTDINGCNEIIRNHETGLVVPVRDSQALHDAMLLLVKDKQLREQFGQKSRTYVVENFQSQYVWERLLSEYKASLRMHN